MGRLTARFIKNKFRGIPYTSQLRMSHVGNFSIFQFLYFKFIQAQEVLYGYNAYVLVDSSWPLNGILRDPKKHNWRMRRNIQGSAFNRKLYG